MLLSTIDRGLNLMQVSVFWIKVIQGSIILAAMLIDAQRVRLQELSNIAVMADAKVGRRARGSLHSNYGLHFKPKHQVKDRDPRALSRSR